MRLKDIFWPWGAVKERDEAWEAHDKELEWGDRYYSGWLRANVIKDNLRSECIRLHGEVERLNDVKDEILGKHYEFRNSIIEVVSRDMQNDLNPRIGDGLSYGNEVRYTYGMPGPIRGVVR